MANQPFPTDMQALRNRPRQHLEQGAVTPRYRANPETLIKLVSAALATEIACVLCYKRHFFMASGINAPSVAQAFCSMLMRSNCTPINWRSASCS